MDRLDTMRYVVIADSYDDYRKLIEEKIDKMLENDELKHASITKGEARISSNDNVIDVYYYPRGVNDIRGIEYYKLLDLAKGQRQSHDDIREHSKIIDAFNVVHKV